MKKEYFRELESEADLALKNRDFERAFFLSEKLAKENVPSAMFTCGLIMEKGWIGGIKDLDRALYFYRDLAIKFNDDEGYLGCVRIFLAKRDIKNRDKAINYCLGAANGRLKHVALLLLGGVYEELCDPAEHEQARRAYLKAFFSGSAWALRKYAMSMMKSNHAMTGIIIHVIATIVSPFYVIFGGLRVTRKG